MNVFYREGVKKALEKLGTFSFADDDPAAWAQLRAGRLPESEFNSRMSFNPNSAPKPPAAMPTPMRTQATLGRSELSSMSPEQVYTHLGFKPSFGQSAEQMVSRGAGTVVGRPLRAMAPAAEHAGEGMLGRGLSALSKVIK